MSEFSDWFKDTFQNCYCDKGNLVDQDKFSEIVQLVLDNEADDESLALFEQKIKTCMQSNSTFQKEKSIRDQIQTKLSEHKAEIPENLAAMIRNSINS